ncbi:YbaB/EbfC family nucleoid-associated protein [Mesomycoplasma hyopneumoniae]|uniref:YbaB/EbfC family nucleoid-associated protein n=1 Tax=Mesomycoplasma hyopneumoniae TaxID=2099 RepID=UPI003877DC0E
MNFQKLLKQAQKIQKDQKVKKNALAKMDFDFENQGISLTITGDFELKKIKISPILVDKDDIETLEDLLSITLNQALLKIKEENEKISDYQNQV